MTLICALENQVYFIFLQILIKRVGVTSMYQNSKLGLALDSRHAVKTVSSIPVKNTQPIKGLK
jgi:hypothetical protein